MSSGKRYPNPKTVHTFCIPPNCSGIQKFRLNIPDPVTRDIFSALIDNRRDDQGNDLSRPAFSSTKHVEPDNYDPKLPEVVSCDVSCLPEIEFLPIAQDSPCMAAVRATILGGLPPPGGSSDIRQELVTVLDFLFGNFDILMASDATCAGEILDLYVIFDDRLPIIWGRNIDDDGSSTDIVFERAPFRFPLTFEKFSIGLYSRTNDVFYAPLEYQTPA